MSGEYSRVRIPAEVEKPDRIMAGLTARQLAIFAAAGALLWAAYLATRRLVPLVAFAAVAVPVAGTATLLAVGRADGLPVDRVLLAAWRHLCSPRRLVPAPEGVPPVAPFLGKQAGAPPAPLRLPLAGISADGLVDLGPEGAAVVCRASSVTFSLRTPAEQEALVAGFARFLNSLTEAVQVLVRAEPVELGPMVDELLDRAPSLAHPGLERAAREHACFLTDLGSRGPCCVGRCWSSFASHAARARRSGCAAGPRRRSRPSLPRG